MSNPIICGPMLRKVTKESVSVFIALDIYSKVTLQLYQENDNKGDNSPMGEIKEVEPKRIGKNLWVIVITLDTSSLNLEIGKNYYYNIILSSEFGVQGNSLRDLGFLDSNNPIIGFPLGYSEHQLPSFSLPPTLENLNIIHGSCRKPHGGGTDQLAELDYLIQKDQYNALKRPHQLFLTGDQIYADDVVPELLTELTKQGRELLGVSENFSTSINHDTELGLEESGIKRRKEFIKRTKFTSGESDFHLIFLSEFYSMYLFAWSGYPYNLNDLSSPFENNKNSKFPQSNLEMIGACQGDLDYNKRVKNLTSFCNTLKKVRRALANISTYMIFDDHDVTDDWNIDKKWKINASQDSYTSQIIQNALMAYAIFQDWGNQPEKYQENNAFWKEVTYSNGIINSVRSPKNTMFNNTKIMELLGLTPSPITHTWYYHYTFEEHIIYVLDTRTKRNYITVKERENVQLIKETDFKKQMVPQLDSNKLAIVISPAPILGMIIVEELIQKLPVTLSLLLGTNIRDNVDFETWASDTDIFNSLLFHLSSYKSVLILSGDVHYGYTNSCSYFKKNLNNNGSRIIQLCSSSLKNKTSQTTAVENIIDIPLISADIPNKIMSYLNLNSEKGRYTIEYLSHIRKYNNFQVDNNFNCFDKIIGETNIGRIYFTTNHNKTLKEVIHELHNREEIRKEEKNKLIFSCKTLLSPPPLTERPLNIGGSII